MTWDEYDFVSPEKKAEWDYVVSAFPDLKGEGWHRRPCTRCYEIDGKEDRKASLGYNTRTGGYNCFRCGMHGSLPLFYREKIGQDEFIFKRVAGEVQQPKLLEVAESFVPIFTEPGLSAQTFQFARDYLIKKRGLDAQACKEAKVGAAVSGKLANRVIVPILGYNDGRNWRGWVARDTTGSSQLPYRYPKGMNRIGLLYNEACLYEETDEPCFIVEGVLDTLSLWPHSVAVLGKPLDSQLELLFKAKRPLAVCLDGDAWAEGQAFAWRLRWGGARAGNIRLPPKADPDEMDKNWLKEEARRCIQQK